MNTRSLLMVCVIALASILRLYQLGKTPLSLEWDEVAIGYDAYSILHTGRDQFGTWFPLTFRSLDDYKPPIYEYLAVPTIAAFGVTAYGVRLPSALAGILSSTMVMYLSYEIASSVTRMRRHAWKIGLLSGFFLAVSPWNLQFSRAAFEVNVSVCITIAAVLCFFVGLRRPTTFLLSALFFGIDLFSYHSTRVVTPLLMISLFMLHHSRLPRRRYIVGFFSVYVFFFASVLPILLSKEAQIRFTATNIFNPGARYLDERDLPAEYLSERIKDRTAGYELAGKIFHNQRFIFFDYETLKKAARKYISHFGFEYLFVYGDAPLHHAPGFGLLYIWELPFLLLGLMTMLWYMNRYTLSLLAWMLIAPIPVAVTREAPHAVRSELLLPTFQIFIAIGVWQGSLLLWKEYGRFCTALFLGGVVLFSCNIAYYLHQYYVHTNYELSDKWLYGRKEAVEMTERLKGSYDTVLVSLHVDMPYIFWLFYTAYPPEQYLREGGTVSGGFADERNHFDVYQFRNYKYDTLDRETSYLLVGTEKDIPAYAHIIATIPYLDGSPGLILASNR